jgi:hypothetical protein
VIDEVISRWWIDAAVSKINEMRARHLYIDVVELIGAT